jgi:hypothetical protein
VFIREYLLLEAATGGNFSDEEGDLAEVTEAEDNDDDDDDDDDDDESEEEEDECLKAAMLEVKKNSKMKSDRPVESSSKPLPLPPAGTSSVLSLVSQSMRQIADPTDPFAKLAKQLKSKKESTD